MFHFSSFLSCFISKAQSTPFYGLLSKSFFDECLSRTFIGSFSNHFCFLKFLKFFKWLIFLNQIRYKQSVQLSSFSVRLRREDTPKTLSVSSMNFIYIFVFYMRFITDSNLIDIWTLTFLILQTWIILANSSA